MKTTNKPMTLLPAAPGVCPECAVDHGPDEPHNQPSTYYQIKFYQDNARWPTWEDALKHCTPETKEFWMIELRKRGIEI